MESQKKRGAPTKYEPQFAEEARQLCLLTGATNVDLAKHFGVSQTTIKTWYKEKPEFLAAVKAGKLGADMKVAEGLYKRATGFEHHEVTREGDAPFDQATGGYDKKLLKVTKVVTKYIPPDAGAALNWLKNRQPEHWRDKVHIDLAAELDLTMNLDGPSTQEEDQG